MISLLLIIPLIGCIYLLPINENSIHAKSRMKKIALFFSLLNLFISIIMWIEFDSNTSGYQFVYEFKELSFCHLNVGIDGTSLYFILLTTFITPICLLSNWIDIKDKIKYFLISFLILETLQIAVFVVLDLLLFYIFFESVLIPLFLIILTWGASQAKIRAAYLLFLYTLFGSLFMLLAIITILFYLGSTDFQLISLSEISLESQKWLWLSPSFSKRDMTSRVIPDIIDSEPSLLKRFPGSNKKYLPSNTSCKEIVIYGSNLCTTVNYPPYTSIVRYMVEIPSNLNSIIVGLLLSDGWLFKNNAGNTLLGLKQSMFNSTFVFYVFNKLSHYCSRYPTITSTRLKGKIFKGVQMVTRVYPCFTKWHSIFYVNNKKIVPVDLYHLLTYEALAYWIMGDGTRSKKGLILQTQSFTLK
uniref:NADH-ubiquinone oxidoreductase chain 4 n=1 Tax=Mutinus fleischeri TaxID=2218478 RepID=A0A8K1RBW0_9AGAM|nr:NADH dehydrogenase subunit 4 [Mutinus fleischeri]